MKYILMAALGTFDGKTGFRPYLELGFAPATIAEHSEDAFTNSNALRFFPAPADGEANMYGLYLSASSEIPIAFGELSDTMFLERGTEPVVTGGRLLVERELLDGGLIGDW